MMKIDVIAVGRLKKGPYYDLYQEYQKRTRWTVTLHEIESKYTEAAHIQGDEARKIKEHIKDDAFVIVMDERGDGLRSLDFAKTLEKLQNNNENYIQFIIGGADGLTDEVRGRANLLLSFGQQTWPHMLARVMLFEQIYRAQQILAGHPYHRE
ncbi:MAG: 23S rRNA (pseudouridine(1915)-N(3))-methyltransferase RlmH [Alphaproteobacteria bacterium]|jgi:23S rRNA (pseudouridine1915-N3)-methyltransferase|nr:23S rRNA (pseudouridine(1915)-N(3))-methyltransferase RlmH [Alphaproteobacteria bacterium]